MQTRKEVISKALRKKLLKGLLACYMINILNLMAFLGALISKYMTGETEFVDDLSMLITSDALAFVEFILYMITIKLKSKVALVINWVILSAALVTKLVVILSFGSGKTVPGAQWVIITTLLIEILLLGYPSWIWKKVLKKKWVKYFDVSKKMSLTNEDGAAYARKPETQPEPMPRTTTFGDPQADKSETNLR